MIASAAPALPGPRPRRAPRPDPPADVRLPRLSPEPVLDDAADGSTNDGARESDRERRHSLDHDGNIRGRWVFRKPQSPAPFADYLFSVPQQLSVAPMILLAVVAVDVQRKSFRRAIAQSVQLGGRARRGGSGIRNGGVVHWRFLEFRLDSRTIAWTFLLLSPKICACSSTVDPFAIASTMTLLRPGGR